MAYDFIQIEQRWQSHWAQHGTFKALNPGDAGFDPAKPKFYVLDMFPYPSGVGLHVGHPLGYIATDIVARYKRMRGYAVLHPMGYDAFGLPAEQYAVEKGIHPRITTQQNIDNMSRQLRRLGLSYDWDRCLATTDPDYYRWTQWIFLQIYNAWFDPMQDKARPIGDLIRILENGQAWVGLDGELVWAGVGEGINAITGMPVGVRKWQELSAGERREFIDDRRLAFLDESPVNWCPQLGTVLANEEVTADGRSERGNFPVYRRPLKQWMLRITAYADRLIEDLDLVDWPEPIKQMQRNWIGSSRGAAVEFPLAYGDSTGGDDAVAVFTTRPDTLFGATYMVLAPEHPLVEMITTGEQYYAVSAYRKQAAGKTDVDRQAEAARGAKSGVFTGAFAINPVNNAKIPIWIADYVLMGYGTGAIMAVPAHDQRDFEFAKQFGLPVRAVVMPPGDWLIQHAPAEKKSAPPAELVELYRQNPAAFDEAFGGEGTAIHSANDRVILDGLPTQEAKSRMIDDLEKAGVGHGQTQYKLRDWLFSRQRYWGEPFPILHGEDGEVVALDESELPVLLPEMEDFRPTASDDPDAPPRPPLSRAPEAWKTILRNGKKYTREFNTMPQWAGSCWYYLRYLDPKNDKTPVSKNVETYWMKKPAQKTPSQLEDSQRRALSSEIRNQKSEIRNASPGGVDLYVGGVEHAVLHLLYARFWHKILFDLGHLSTPEPFGKLFNQGYIQAYAYVDERGIYVPAEEVVDQDGKPAMEVQDKPDRRFSYRGKPVKREYGKMGKSLKNAIAPDDICTQYGCDTLRLYEMYLGPLDQSKLWSTTDIIGVHRFLQRIWRLFVEEETNALRVGDVPVPEDLNRLLHKTLKRVTDAMESMSYNVAIAALIELNNDLVKRYASDVGKGSVPKAVAGTMTLMLAPLAPHIAEELWHRLGNEGSISAQPWPVYDPALLVESSIEYPVQVNGKLRGKVTVPADADNAAVEAAALADEKVKSFTTGKSVKKIIVVKGKLVNVVVA